MTTSWRLIDGYSELDFLRDKIQKIDDLLELYRQHIESEDIHVDLTTIVLVKAMTDIVEEMPDEFD